MRAPVVPHSHQQMIVLVISIAAILVCKPRPIIPLKATCPTIFIIFTVQPLSCYINIARSNN